MMNEFEKKFIKTVEELFKLTDEQHQIVLKAYKESLDRIREMLAKFFIRYAVDGKLPYHELVKYNRLLALEEQIREEIRKLGGIEEKEVNLILNDVYKEAYYRTAFLIESNVQTMIDFALLKPEFVKEAVRFNWSGVPFSERIWNSKNALINALRTEITRGIIEGESIEKIARRIKKQFDSSAYQAQRLVCTEAARVISSAQEKIYMDSGVVEKVQWLSTLDSRTSPICRDRDGKTWNLDELHPTPPAHPNCRSTLIPLISGYNPSKRKDNESKEIIQYKTYEEWYQARVK